MPFCPDCKAMLYPKKGGGMECRKCGYSPDKLKSSKISQDVQVKETVILEEAHVSTEPKMKAECSKCGNLEAHWILRQTRSSDEPETRIMTCTKCKHRWREY